MQYILILDSCQRTQGNITFPSTLTFYEEGIEKTTALVYAIEKEQS